MKECTKCPEPEWEEEEVSNATFVKNEYSNDYLYTTNPEKGDIIPECRYSLDGCPVN